MALSYPEFETAINQLEHAWQNSNDTTTWQDASIHTTRHEPQVSFLRVTRSLAGTSDNEVSTGEEDPSLEDEHDEEALPKTETSAATSNVLVTHDIIHHPTYQCPALYIELASAAQARHSADKLYELLVPNTYKAPLRSVGVMGSLSLTDHPISNKPVYWVHPCRTQEAMSDIGSARDGDVAGVDYLLAWFGIIGASVGLNVPVPLAKVLSGGRKRWDEG